MNVFESRLKDKLIENSKMSLTPLMVPGDKILVTQEYLERVNDHGHFVGECMIATVFSFGYEIMKGGQYANVNFNDVIPYSTAGYVLQKLNL